MQPLKRSSKAPHVWRHCQIMSVLHFRTIFLFNTVAYNGFHSLIERCMCACMPIVNITELLHSSPLDYFVTDLACADASLSDLSTDEIKAISSVRDNIEYVECLKTDTALEAPEGFEPDSIVSAINKIKWAFHFSELNWPHSSGRITKKEAVDREMNIATWFFNFYNESCAFVLILFGIVYVINEGSAQKVIYLATQLIFYNWRQKEFNEKNYGPMKWNENGIWCFNSEKFNLTQNNNLHITSSSDCS